MRWFTVEPPVKVGDNTITLDWVERQCVILNILIPGLCVEVLRGLAYLLFHSVSVFVFLFALCILLVFSNCYLLGHLYC